MRFMSLIIFSLQLTFFQNCANRQTDNQQQFWLNTEYVKCLQRDLPCECEREVVTYFSLNLNFDHGGRSEVLLLKFGQLEPYNYPIKQATLNEYFLLKSMEDSSVWAKIIIKDKVLTFMEKGRISEFVASTVTEGVRWNHYFLDNVVLLNQSFHARGFVSLDSIVHEDSLRCFCNNWMNGVNLLSVEGAPKSWVMEIEGDSLRILKVTNPEKDPDDPVQTQLVAAYKWR
jgi:hypothetical protein